VNRADTNGPAYGETERKLDAEAAVADIDGHGIQGFVGVVHLTPHLVARLMPFFLSSGVW
jgi:hypothetical protein